MTLRTKTHLLYESEYIVRNQQRLLIEPTVIHSVCPEKQFRDATPKSLLDDTLEIYLVALEADNIPVEHNITEKYGPARSVQQHIVGN